MLGAQQAVENLFHHNGVEFDELGQGLDHFFLEGAGGRAPQPRGGSRSPRPLRSELPPGPQACSPSLITPVRAPAVTHPGRLTGFPAKGESYHPLYKPGDGGALRAPLGTRRGNTCWGQGGSLRSAGTPARVAPLGLGTGDRAHRGAACLRAQRWRRPSPQCAPACRTPGRGRSS